MNHGNYVISLNRFTKWLAGLVEAEGIDLFTGFPASEILSTATAWPAYEPAIAASASTASARSTFEPGVDIRAKVTIFADGVRGNLTKSLVRQLGLDDGRSPQLYALGIKELWEVPADRLAAGSVIHTMGFPLRMDEFGGGFIYAMPDGVLRLAFWRVSTIATRCSIRTSRFSTSSDTRSSRRCSTAGRWCATKRRRCRKAAGTRSRNCTRVAR